MQKGKSPPHINLDGANLKNFKTSRFQVVAKRISAIYQLIYYPVSSDRGLWVTFWVVKIFS